MGLVTRALLTAGVLLLLLVAGLAWLVARQVVTPIRMARRVAERLAAGQLAGAAAGEWGGRPGAAGDVLQPDGLQPAAADPPARGAEPAPAPLRLRRLPRAAHAAHDGADGRRRAVRRPGPASTRSTARAAELLQLELDRFETLLADLLEISRFDAGAAVLEAEDVDLVDVARRVVDMTRALAEQRHTRVVVETPGHACLAEADPRRVERIVRNLVTNAIDHAEGRDIRLLVAGDDHSAAIAVRDHGVGLAPGESAMVFNRFWRADPARARTSGGTGLGPVHLPGGHPPARRLAAGVGPARGGRPVPAHPAAPALAAAAAQPAAAGPDRRPESA